MMGPVEQWHKIREPIEFKTSAYNSQIQMDVARTHSSDTWFDPHRKTICKILNAFANTNIGFGYPQGLNFLVFPLWKVYHDSIPEWAMHDTYYSLHHLVGALLSVYPIHKSDTAALRQIELICTVVKLKSTKRYPDLRKIIFLPDYEPLIISLVSRMVPTMFANVYDIDDCLVLWDSILQEGDILESVIKCVVVIICINHNVLEYLPLESCMSVIKESAPLTISSVKNFGHLV
jgi:hypothetical protein